MAVKPLHKNLIDAFYLRDNNYFCLKYQNYEFRSKSKDHDSKNKEFEN